MVEDGGHYAIIDGVRYTVVSVQDRDTMDVIDGTAYGYLTIGVTYEVEQDGDSKEG